MDFKRTRTVDRKFEVWRAVRSRVRGTSLGIFQTRAEAEAFMGYKRRLGISNAKRASECHATSGTAPAGTKGSAPQVGSYYLGAGD